MAAFTGSSKPDTKTGTDDPDTFDYFQGGNDKLKGKAGADIFDFGATFTANDRVDGGDDSDKLELDGDYSKGVVFKATTLTNVEQLILNDGFSYKFKTHDKTIAAKASLGINAMALESGYKLTFDASAEKNGNVSVTADAATLDLKFGNGTNGVTANDGNNTIKSGKGTLGVSLGDGSNTISAKGKLSGIIGDGDNTVTSANGDDIVSLGIGKNTVKSGGGDDTISIDSTSTAANIIDAGDGNNIVNAAGGSDDITTGKDDDIIIGGEGDNIISSTGGKDLITAGSGKDTFILGAGFDVTDIIVDAGGSNDLLKLDGNYAKLVALTNQLNGIDEIHFAAKHDYNFSFGDKIVAAGATMTLDANDLGASDTLFFDGSAELDGKFVIKSGAGADRFTGGALGDVFSYLGIKLSGAKHDTLTGFDFLSDKIEFIDVALIDPTVASGTLSASKFDANLKSALAGKLDTGHAVLFTPNKGSFAGSTFLIVDDFQSGDGYHAGKDLVVRLVNPLNIGDIDPGDFIA